MRDLSYGLFIRAQYHAGDDMAKRFQEVVAQVRLADKLGFADLLTGMHYASAPFQQYQQLPLLARLMAETEQMRIVAGIVLLSLHKPLDIAEQLATLDVMSGGRLVFGLGLGYRDVEFKGFGTTQEERVPRLVENLAAIKRETKMTGNSREQRAQRCEELVRWSYCRVGTHHSRKSDDEIIFTRQQGRWNISFHELFFCYRFG